MMNNKRDIEILKKIIKYCEEIFQTQKYFGNNYDIFENNFIYQNAISMSILQIGELSNHLSNNFRETYHIIPWRNIIGIRNFMAHEYGNLDTNIIWSTILKDIPELYKNCLKIIKKINY